MQKRSKKLLRALSRALFEGCASVPAENFPASLKWAENSAKLFREYGCLEIVKSWEDNVPDGKQTNFRRAGAAKRGEKIAFTWQVWPDKESFNAAEAKPDEDPRMDSAGAPPFDPKRLILGCFQPIFFVGRT